MKYKNLGGTNVKISSIGLGTNFNPYHPDTNQKLISLMQEALNLGLNFFDSSELYLNGNSEKLIGQAFKKRRGEVFISTKFSPENCSYERVVKSCEASLKRLQTDYIDLYQIHWPNPIIPIEQTLKALEKLRKVGKVKYIGVCNFSLRQLKHIQKVSKLPIVSLQTEYNLLERSIEYDLLPYCEKNKITIIAYTPLNSGNILKTEKYLKIFSDLSKKYNRTASQIILNFLISHPTVVVIPATANIIHLEENAKSTEFVLEKKDIQLLTKTFTTKVINIDTGKIKVTTIPHHAAYKTIEEALTNKLNFFPSPKTLSEDIQKGDFLKPVRVKVLQKKKGDFEYELLGGRIRYWAWVIAYHGKKPIPAIVENS
ncbi:MAG: aldo/keto reductase [Microgenomates group bacterium Gr01-1014_7]|nr:MAG: aldo/keto reductase [Microgenomates group bacterium Gr01-1014_7]